MKRSKLIFTTDLADLSPVLFAGTPVLRQFDRLKSALETRGHSAFSVLAEPVLGPPQNRGFKGAAWYAEGQGESLTLSELSAQERQLVVDDLRNNLHAISDLFSDKSIGPMLRSAIMIPDAESNRVIDGRAVLVNWGFVPASLSQTEAALEKHFVETLGSIIGWFGFPDVHPEGADEVSGLSNHAFKVTEAPLAAATHAAVTDAPPISAQGLAHEPSRSRFLVLGTALFLLGILVGLIMTLYPRYWWPGSELISNDQVAAETATKELIAERDHLREQLANKVCTAPEALLPKRSMEQPQRPALPQQPGEITPPVLKGSETPAPKPVIDAPTPKIQREAELKMTELPQIARELPPCEKEEAPDEVMLIMDTSGSMRMPAGHHPEFTEIERLATAGDPVKYRQMEALMDQPGRKRIDDSRAAASELMGSLPRKAAVGIVSFDGQCGAKMDLGPTLDRDQSRRVIESLGAKGATPIAATLRQVQNAFAAGGNPNLPRSVILITDGEETCGGDPCAEAKLLAQTYKNLKIHVIDVTGTSKLQCLADATNGTIVKAGNLAELKAAVARAAKGPEPKNECKATDFPQSQSPTMPSQSRRDEQSQLSGTDPVPESTMLKLPDGPSTDLSFIQGCWRTEPFKHKPSQNNPSISTYCFDQNGKGWLENSQNLFCRPAAEARYVGNELTINDSDCPPSWFADHLICRRDVDGTALCRGEAQIPGQPPHQWTVRMQRMR
jgi:hypothetical protein